MRLRRPRRGAHLAALAAVLGSLLAVPAASQAALYTINPCIAGRTPFAGSQMLSGDGNTTIDNQCAAGAGLRMSFVSPTNQSVAGAGNGFRFRIPDAFPHAHIIQLSGNITIALRNGNPSGLFTIDESNGGYDPDGGPQMTWPQGVSPLFGPTDFLQTPHSPTRSIIWRISPTTSPGTTDFDSTALGANFILNGMSVTMDDPTAPLASTVSSTGLLDGTVQSGKRILTLDARDEDSGVYNVSVRSGAGEVANLGGQGGGCIYASVEACPSDRAGDVVVDTSKLANGPQILALVTQDAAGNQQTTYTPVFTVSNTAATPPPGPTPTPAPLPANGDPKGTPLITSSAKTTKAAKATSRSTTWHHRITLSGRLLAADRTPMAGATLVVTQTPTIKGAPTATIASITTDEKGAYKASFQATSSAQIAVQYPQHVGGADYSAARLIKLAVRAHVTLKRSGALARGRAMRFSGRVDATPLPATGARVAIQYHSTSGAWLSADVVTTTASGAFTWRHTFRTAARYRLRARVLRDPQLGAAPNNSAELRFRLR